MTENMESAAQHMIQLCDDMHSVTRSSVDANLRSVTAAAKGWEEGSQSASHLAKENIARMINASKTVSEAKSMRDVMALQQDFMKECMDFWMAGASKLSEISARTAKDVVEPVAQHTNETFSRLMQKTRKAA